MDVDQVEKCSLVDVDQAALSLVDGTFDGQNGTFHDQML